MIAKTATPPPEPATHLNPIAPPEAAVGELTDIQRSRWGKLDATVKRGAETFYDVGSALAEIRDGRLFRERLGKTPPNKPEAAPATESEKAAPPVVETEDARPAQDGADAGAVEVDDELATAEDCADGDAPAFEFADGSQLMESEWADGIFPRDRIRNEFETIARTYPKDAERDARHTRSQTRSRAKNQRNGI